jgi:hypothetical protein
MTVTMIKRRRDGLTLHPHGLVAACALLEARAATPEEMDTLDHETVGSAAVEPGGPEQQEAGL